MRSEQQRRHAATLSLGLAVLTAWPAGARDADDGPLAEAPGRDLVAAHCGACHSLALVTQNRGDAAHWTKLIRWMQAEHNLWDLGAAEDDIVAYLAGQYGAPDLSPRRAPLDTEWWTPEH